jgi:hypothetical protein
MKAALTINGTAIHLHPVRAVATERKVTLRVKLPNKMGAEVVAIELTLPDLIGLTELIDIVARDAAADDGDVIAALVRDLEARRG